VLSKRGQRTGDFKPVSSSFRGSLAALRRLLCGSEPTYEDHSVSANHLQDYVNEYAFRYNHRDGSGDVRRG